MLKLQGMGVDSLSIQWFKSYLTNRIQRTNVGKAVSSTRLVNIGVPQRSVLGPLLFLAYINDLTESLVNCEALLFADDTAIYYSASSSVDLQRILNEDLDRVKNWLNDHRLTLNVSKTKFMIIGGTQRLNRLGSLKLLIEEDSLERVQQFKYLGVVINENLDWSEHIDHIYTKIAKRLGLRKIKYLLPSTSRELIFNSLILPILDYGDIVWVDRCNTLLMDRIQVLQNKAAKLIL